MIVVISDAFPPKSVGGAELSLAGSLAAMPLDVQLDTVVVSFTADRRAVGVRRQPDSRVLSLHLPWSGLRSRFDGRGRTARLFFQVRTRLLDHGRRVCGHVHATGFRGLLEYARARCSRRPAMRDDRLWYLRHPLLPYLRRLLTTLSVSLVHADNFESICLMHALRLRYGLSVPTVGFVRDLRFICAHPTNCMWYEGVRCDQCDLSCADGGDPQRAIPLTVLRENKAWRMDALGSLDRIVVASRFMQRYIGGLISDSPVTIVPNEVVIANAHEVAPSVDLLVVGYMRADKGQDRAIRLLASLAEDHPHVTLRLIGSGAGWTEHLRSLASGLGVGDRVEFLGIVPHDQLDAHYRSARLVVLPNRCPEAFGRVPVEAALCGVPVLAQNIGAYVDSIQHGRTGYLFSDDSEMVRYARLLLDDEMKRQEMGRYARTCASRTGRKADLLSTWQSADSVVCHPSWR